VKYIRVKKGQDVFWAVLSGDKVNVLKNAPYFGINYSGQVLSLSEVTLLAPCEPSKIVAVGQNYRDHVLELGHEIPDHPIIFIKPPTAVNDPEGKIMLPDTSKRVDYEGELAFVIKKDAYRVKRESAFDFVFAYTCLNDVTARDLQSLDGQWSRAKSFDSFSPIGPCLVDGLDPLNLKVETRLNGELKQSSRTGEFIFDIPCLIEFITDCMTLKAGDVVTTGTPMGVGPMKSGDVVEVEIEGIGVLKNHAVER